MDTIEKRQVKTAEGLREQLANMEKDLSVGDYRTARIKAIEEKIGAFTLGGDLSLFLQGFSNPDGKDRVDGSYSGDLFLMVPIGGNGNLYLRGQVGEGEGIAGDLPPTFSGPNADIASTGARFDLVEAWYRTTFPVPDVKDQRLDLTIGKMGATGIFDANAVANSETTQFMANIFVNNLSVEFAGDENGYGPGVVLGYRLTSIDRKDLKVVGRVGLFEGSINGEGTFKRVFDRPFVIGEVDIKRSSYGLDGNYRIYAWVNQNDHANWEGTDNNLTNQGLGLSLDQRVSNDVTLFARYGFQDADVSRLDQVFTLGGQIIGNGWNRKNDVIGVASGLLKTGSKYEDVSLSVDGYEAKGNENYIEAYYKYWANTNLSISPDFQYVINPGRGQGKGPNIHICGKDAADVLRASLPSMSVKR